MTRAARIAAWLVAGLTTGVAAAQAPVPEAGGDAVESLRDAWRMALAQDPALAAAQADVEAAAANERAARAARMPLVEASAGYTRYDTAPSLQIVSPSVAFRSPPLFDDDDAMMGGVQLTLPLYTGGVLSASIRAARLQRDSAEAAGEQALADLKLDVAERYVALLRARRALEAADARVAGLTAHAADVEAMVGRELVATSDLLAARVALADAGQQRLRARNGVELAQAAYNRRLGQPLQRVPPIDERAALDGLAEETRPLAELQQLARARRSELRALDAGAGALAARARAERGRLLPQFALQAGWQHLETTVLDRQDFSTVGLGFRWTLFDGGQTLQRARALDRSRRAAELRHADVASQLDLEVTAARLGLGEAEARREVTREAVAQAEENLRMSRELYGAGLATNTQVLDAIALRIAATNNRDDAVLDAELARLRLARAVGEL